MSLGKGARVAALILLAVMIMALPLTGCGKKPIAAPGDGAQGGGAAPGGGSGGSTSGKTWAYGLLKAGEYVKYTIRAEYSGAVENGWFAWSISDAGGGRLKIAYVGNFDGNDFSGDETVSAENPLADFRVAPLPICMVPILTCRWDTFLADCPWSVGGKWSFEGTSGEVSLEVKGTGAYAGLEGYEGAWTMKVLGDGVVTTSWCVNPDFPLVLHTSYRNTPPGVYEYTLVEAAGF